MHGNYNRNGHIMEEAKQVAFFLGVALVALGLFGVALSVVNSKDRKKIRGFVDKLRPSKKADK